MPQVQINLLAVLVAAVLGMVVGFVWYSQALFGKQWQSLSGYTPEKMKAMKNDMAKTYGIMFVCEIIMAYVLAHFLVFAEARTVAQGMQGGFWAWLGFVATTMLTGVLFDKKPLKLYAINTGYHLASLLVMGALLAAWR